jgi:hypothetical protein
MRFAQRAGPVLGLAAIIATAGACRPRPDAKAEQPSGSVITLEQAVSSCSTLLCSRAGREYPER